MPGHICTHTKLSMLKLNNKYNFPHPYIMFNKDQDNQDFALDIPILRLFPIEPLPPLCHRNRSCADTHLSDHHIQSRRINLMDKFLQITFVLNKHLYCIELTCEFSSMCHLYLKTWGLLEDKQG